MTESLDSRETNLKVRRTPLPVLQLSILLLLRFTESASTYVIFPFVSELLSSIAGEDSAKVGYYAGLMESIRQTLSLISVMYWSRLSDHIGRKPILLLGTLALAASISSFGLSKTFLGLVVSRCIFTAFNSNAGKNLEYHIWNDVENLMKGVIKSMVGEITDHSNNVDAFALLHVPWAIGSSFGAFTGGWLANPSTQYPVYFSNAFWIKYPYFLPCAVMASLALFACLIITIFLSETIPEGLFYRRRLRPGDMEPLLRPLNSSETIQKPSTNPVPLKSLMRRKTLIPILNYVSIASLHASSNVIQPLFLAMPVAIGGLALPPREVGIILGTYGIANSFFQTFILGRLVRRFGVKTVFVSAITAFVPMFTFPPLMNLLVWRHGFSYVVWVMLGCQLSCSLVMECGYGCVYMFITSAAPNKRSLGTTNGLAQTLVPIGRIVIPVVATSVLSLSIERHILWDYAAYVVLVCLTLGGLSLASHLPRILE